MNDTIKNELGEMVHDNPPSQIPLERPVDIAPISVSLKTTGDIYWSQKSRKLAADFEYGSSLGLFGNTSTMSTKKFLVRISDTFRDLIKNECSKNGMSADNFAELFSMLESTLIMLSREIDAKGLKDFDNRVLLAGLHGFITSYLEKMHSNE